VKRNYIIIGLTGMCCDSSHNWSTVMDGYQVFRTDRRGDKGVWVYIYDEAAVMYGAPQ